MVVDTSALLVVLFQEEEAEAYARAMATADECRISAANLLEAGIVVDQQAGAAAGRLLDNLVERAQIQVDPVTRTQAEIARQAYFDYGKGRHPAGLNFGDCFAYALAVEKGDSLLFKGNDFSKTDVAIAEV